MSWLSGWTYRNRITIAGASGSGTYYQVRVRAGETAGAGGDFSLGGYCADFPNDIRFTASDGESLLFHWLEGVTGSAPNRIANFWVLVEDDLSSSKNIYIYFGKGGETSASNGSYTFRFFEDKDTFQATSRISKTTLVSGARAYSFPYLLDLQDGTWLMTYRESASVPDAEHDSSVHIKFSDDEGETWTADETTLSGATVSGYPILPFNATCGVGGGIPLLCPNGDIVTCAGGQDTGASLRLGRQYRSTDGGATFVYEGDSFGDPKFFSSDYFVLGSGIYVVGWYEPAYLGPNYDSRMVVSYDNGHNWSVVGIIASGISDEVGVAYLGGNDLVTILRGGTGQASYRVYSNDMGVTWGTPDNITDELYIYQGGRIFKKDDGTLYLYGRFNTVGNLWHLLTMWVSYDNGIYWHGPFAVDPNSYTFVSAPCAVLKKSDGNFFLVSSAGTLSAPHFVYSYVISDDPPYPIGTVWQEGGMTISVSGEYLRFYDPTDGSAGYTVKYGITAPGRSYSVETRFYNTTLSGNDCFASVAADRSTTNMFYYWYAPLYIDQAHWYYDAVGIDYSGGQWTEGSEYIMQSVVTETDLSTGMSYARRDTNRVIQESVTGKAKAAGTPAYTNTLICSDATYAAVVDARVKWIFMRKHTGTLATEPAFSSAGYIDDGSVFYTIKKVNRIPLY